jgi:hypothetical protein
MFPEALERLIAATLVDGRITDKERMVLVKKAVALGIDQDEFEVVLDARIHEAAPQPDAVPSAVPRDTDKVGRIHKCPACGAVVAGLQARCRECDHEFTDAGASSSIHELLRKLELVVDNEEVPTGMLGRLGAGSREADERASIIRNHVVPNTKAGILEFLALGVPRSRLGRAAKMLNSSLGWVAPHIVLMKRMSQDRQEREREKLAPTWKDKCCEAVHKGRMLFSDDPATLRQIEVFAKELGL